MAMNEVVHIDTTAGGRQRDASFEAGAPIPALELSGFGFAYPSCAPVFDAIDWSVASGSFTLLVGSTGCGKTTLLRSIKPEIAPAGDRAGQLLVFGHEPAQAKGYEATLEVGYVSQSPRNQLVCDTVWHELAFGLENLGLANNEMSRRVAEVAHFFGIEPWINRKTAELSGGQAQMVNLAAVLAMRPRLLLLDEPTAQLDPVASKNFAHALFRINRELGMTVIVATHEPEIMAEYATDCVRMAGGTLVEQNRHEFSSNVNDWPQACEKARSWLQSQRVGNGGLSAAGKAAGLRMTDVFMRYERDGDWVLSGFDIELEQGKINAVVGGNGCGKSTLLRVVAGVAKTERGRVESPLRSSQVLLPQDPKTLFVCDTVAEELDEWRASCGYGQDEVDGLLADFGLADRKGNHPYDLSGGQQQLLAFAKILLTRPRLLLLDEPSKGLDARAKTIVAAKLRSCADAGATVVMSTHDLPFAALLADRVGMMFDGKCACLEPADDFFQGNLFYRPTPDGFSRMLASLADGGRER
jgi:energy-coupling factor transporter ATP-binding protein EcfA2